MVGDLDDSFFVFAVLAFLLGVAGTDGLWVIV
jgi:hypothetical protein